MRIFNSTTLQATWFVLLTSTALVWYGKIDGSAWGLAVGLVLNGYFFKEHKRKELDRLDS